MAEETKKKRTTLHEFNQKYGDPWIWGIFVALIIISIVENYSASSREIAKHGVYMTIIKHCMFLFAGGFITWFIARREYNKQMFLTVFIPLLAVGTILSLAYVNLFGEVINGAQRAIRIGSITFQPTEMAKLSIVTLLAYFIAKHQKDKGLTNKGFILTVIALGGYCLLMFRSSATNCALLGIVWLTMVVIGGVNFNKQTLITVSCFVALGVTGYLIKSSGDNNDKVLQEAQAEVAAMHPEGSNEVVEQAPAAQSDKPKVDRANMRINRIKRWWNNDSLVYWAITEENQQEVFSRMAQAHGGIFGAGLGQSRETSRLPLAFSDYIYSIIVEETGLVGGVIVLLLYLSLLGRATIIVRKCNRALPSMLIIGTASLITAQALFHMAINTGVFPVSGQPLPLISNGGTAVLAMSAAFGIMLSVSRTVAINRKEAKLKKEMEVELPAGLDTENPTQIQPKNIWK